MSIVSKMKKITHETPQAFGGQYYVPFQSIIAQSPGSFAITPAMQEAAANKFFQYLGVSSLQAARQLPSSALMAANAYQVGYDFAPGLFGYGPVVDGQFIRQHPAEA